jgi:hypothetical protein
MGRCKITTNAGKRCKLDDLGRGFCHVHSPDGEWMRQHPDVRAKWLQREDVQALLGGEAVVAGHCSSCTCLTSPERAVEVAQALAMT